MTAPLAGRVVAVTAGRKADEQAELLRRRGAEVIFAPTITTDYLASDDEVRQATARAIAASPDYVVLLTGVGLRGWLDAARGWGMEEELLSTLHAARVLARGPKAAAAARSAGLQPWVVATSERADELLDVLLANAQPRDTVVLQRHGGDEGRFGDQLGAKAIAVLEVPVYRWRLPEDTAAIDALMDAVIGRGVDAVTFTSAPAVENLFERAHDRGRSEELAAAFNDGVVAACVGPVCAGAARNHGITEPVYPDVGRLGLMVRALSNCFSPEES